MPKREPKYQRSKLGQIIDDRNMTLREFAEQIFIKTGYFIAVQNLSNYCTGFKPLKKIEIAKIFADTLDLTINDIL